MNPRIPSIAAAAILGSCALAAAQTNVGTFKDWNAFVSDAPDGKLCFIASQPKDSKYSQPIGGRDPVFFMVTSIPTKGIRNEVSTIIGYSFAANADVSVDVDGKTFKMFTSDSQGDTAWAVAEQQAALVEAMKAGSRLTVQGKSKRGTVSTDTYSLAGISAALDKATTECP